MLAITELVSEKHCV